MKINANYFGPVSYEKEDVIHIRGGLFGFESCTEYLPLSFHEDSDAMLSLQSLDDGSLSFILLNPFRIFPDYAPAVSEEDLKELGAASEADISYYVIAVIRDSIAKSTVNLKAPLAVNALTRQGKQLILEDSGYSFRQALGAVSPKEGS